jgi:rubrerythrin
MKSGLEGRKESGSDLTFSIVIPEKHYICLLCGNCFSVGLPDSDHFCPSCGNQYAKFENYEDCANVYRRNNPNGLAFGG